MFSFAPPRPMRKPSLTPMIDVVFLLLVFFMLASRFGHDGQIPLNGAGGGGDSYQGPPRLVDVYPDALRLNGTPLSADALAGQIAPLTQAPSDLIILRPQDDAPLQRVVDVMQALRAAGYTHLVLAR